MADRGSAPDRRSLAGQGVRFVAAGAINTLLTFLLYEILILFVAYPVAYTISFVAGILFAAVLYARAVFRVVLTVPTALRFAAFYLASYLVGLGLILVLVDTLLIPAWLAPLFVVTIMLPMNFLGSRLALGGR